jgi:hypothetical protein
MESHGRLMTLAQALLSVVALAGCSGAVPLDDSATSCEPRPVADAVRGIGAPTDRGQPFAGLDVRGLSMEDIDEIATAARLPISWRYAYPTGADSSFWECWCIPPPNGRPNDMFYDDDDGHLIVFVSTPIAQQTRPQPAHGWGCEAQPAG